MDDGMARISRAVELAHMLANPLRLKILQALMAGPAAVAELAAITGADQSNLSNHLKALRQHSVVRNRRQGRQINYEIADAAVAQLVQTLTDAAGGAFTELRQPAPLLEARTCYDHLAGRLGVRLFEGLVMSGAVIAPKEPWGEVKPGPAAGKILADVLGVDLKTVMAKKGRRRFAYACPDWSAGVPHLGGALGAAIYQRLLAASWIVRDQAGTRGIRLTNAGERALRSLCSPKGRASSSTRGSVSGSVVKTPDKQ
jgi:DNA-binding transcriptional ArsR family regulator